MRDANRAEAKKILSLQHGQSSIAVHESQGKSGAGVGAKSEVERIVNAPLCA
jgi:hypothetical protein